MMLIFSQTGLMLVERDDEPNLPKYVFFIEHRYMQQSKTVDHLKHSLIVFVWLFVFIGIELLGEGSI